MAARFEGVTLDDGRTVRYSSPDWPKDDPRWSEPSPDETLSYEELVDGEWVPVSAPVSWREFDSKADTFPPENWEPWND